MTIIVWDGTTLAADRMANRHGHASAVDKLFRLNNGELLAISGDLPHGLELKRWYELGADPATFPRKDKDNAFIYVVRKDGFVYSYETSPEAIKFYDRQFAAGCGRDYAYGAMAMGADAIQAASIACSHEVNCGMGIMSLDLHPKPPEPDTVPDPVLPDRPPRKRGKKRG